MPRRWRIVPGKDFAIIGRMFGADFAVAAGAPDVAGGGVGVGCFGFCFGKNTGVDFFYFLKIDVIGVGVITAHYFFLKTGQRLIRP